MQYTIAALALAAAGANAVSSSMSPSAPAPSGCSSSYSGQFGIQVMNVTKSAKMKRQSTDDSTLKITLSNGVLTDDQGRTGEIVANHQFQFDPILQTGAIYTSGFSACSNGSLALGGSAIFYQCLSGGFYNLYDESIGAQCSPIYIEMLPSSGSASVAVTQSADGQPAVSTQATARPISQITDGQIQASTSATARPVSQISDGQIQATTMASSARPVSQISDGQVQASTGRPVSQISDGQIQASTAAATGRPVSQISDGQIQGATAAANGSYASATASVVAYTGAGVQTAVSGGLLGLGAIVALLL